LLRRNDKPRSLSACNAQADNAGMHSYDVLDKDQMAQNKLYQLIINRLDGDKVHSQSYQEQIFKLVQKGIGGFIIFGGEMDEVRAFIDKLQSMSETPLFVASDIERGVGRQIKGGTRFPCQMAVSAAIRKDMPEDVSLLRDAVNAIALEAIDVGINMPLIPVLDVNQRPDNPIICTRAFSDNPEDVSWFGSAYIKVLESSGLLSCGKHFPGHGDTSIDSHISLPTITKSYKDLMALDVMPFVKAIENGVSSIMVGHLLVPALDSMPASLSKKVVRELLRDKLGFNGLIITDALNMSAINGIKNVSAKCIKAGVDILLHPINVDTAVKEIEDAIRINEIDEGCIESALGRILKAKAKLSGIKKTGVDYSRSRNLSTLITDMSITLVKGAGLLPITDAHVILAGADKFHEPSLWKGHFRDVTTIHDTPLLPSFEKSPLNLPFTKGGQGGLSDKTIIFAIFTEVSAWRGSSGIEDEEKQRIIELIKLVPEEPAPYLIRGLNRGKAKRSIVISFGSPYILPHFKDADMLIAAYDGAVESQRAVIKCLKVEMGCRGEMPVKLNLT